MRWRRLPSSTTLTAPPPSTSTPPSLSPSSWSCVRISRLKEKDLLTICLCLSAGPPAGVYPLHRPLPLLRLLLIRADGLQWLRSTGAKLRGSGSFLRSAVQVILEPGRGVQICKLTRSSDLWPLSFLPSVSERWGRKPEGHLQRQRRLDWEQRGQSRQDSQEHRAGLTSQQPPRQQRQAHQLDYHLSVSPLMLSRLRS